jgi:hypothetical protein
VIDWQLATKEGSFGNLNETGKHVRTPLRTLKIETSRGTVVQW